MEDRDGSILSKQGQWPVSRRCFLDAQQIKALRQCAQERVNKNGRRRRSAVLEWIVIEIALETGLRVSEIAALRCGDIWLAQSTGSLLVRKGKGGKRREVMFGAGLRQSLGQYLRWKHQWGEGLEPDSPLLVSSHTGSTPTSRALQKMFRRVASQAGIGGHSFHHLRHTYASYLHRSSGHNLRLVQKQLGHASIRTTQIYADVFEEEALKAIDRLYA